MTKRGKAKATLRAIEQAKKLSSPSKRQIQAIARRTGVHWVTIYRGLTNA